tara:strand:+ start:1458 stop:1577 length:120 start_codon:yes stop_codon:yes gene_type:complete
VIRFGDAALAKNEIGWEPIVGFSELVNRMVDNDLQEYDI